MDQLSKKEFAMSAVIGLLLGVIMGAMVSLSVIKEHRKCNELKRENVLLHEIVLQQQEQLK